MKATLEARLNAKTMERHCLLQGASGSGKSSELLAMIHSCIRATNSKNNLASIVVIEPHFDLAAKLMAARALDMDRLVYISLTIQHESGWNKEKITPVFNPFQLPKDADEAFKNTLAAQLTSTIAEMVESSQYAITVNMHMLLLPAVLVTLSSPNPCMATLKRMLTDGMNDDLLQIGLSYPHVQIQDFFLNHWKSKDYDMTKRALISKINYLMNDITLYDVMNGDGIDIQSCLDEGKVIIVNAPIGANPFAANLIGRLMIAYIFSVLLRRVNSNDERVPCYLFIDEIDCYASSTLGDMLRQSRKFGGRIILSGQSLKSLPAALRGALLTNTYLKMLSISDGETRRLMAPEMNVSAEELAKIEPMTFMVSMNDGAKTKPFRIKVPILSKHLFLNKQETKDRLFYLIQNSGVFKPASPPPPATPFPNEEQTKQSSKKTKSDDFGAPPAFNT